jgi:hypothetical protein
MGNRVTDYIIGSLLLAWFLSLFSFDKLFVDACYEFFSIHLTYAAYYFLFFIGGLVLFGIEEFIQQKQIKEAQEIQEIMEKDKEE